MLSGQALGLPHQLALLYPKRVEKIRGGGGITQEVAT